MKFEGCTIQKPEYVIHCGHDHRYRGAAETGRAAAEDKLLRDLASGKIDQYSDEYASWLHGRYNEAQNITWNKRLKAVDFNAKDHLSAQLMEANIHRFSAAKSVAMLSELNNILPTSTGFSDFKLKSAEILGEFNSNFMRTEYNMAQATAQNGAAYLRQLDDVEDFPFWEYQTIGDDRVRAAHANLDGKLFNADDPAFNTIYPPNGFGCRCEVIPRESKGGKKLSTEKDALEALAENDELERMKKGRFNTNKGRTSVIYDENIFYTSQFNEAELDVVTNGVRTARQLKSNSFSKLDLKERDSSFKAEYFSSKKGLNDLDNAKRIRLLDNKNRPTHLKDTRLKDIDANIIEFTEDVIQDASEIYLLKEGSNHNVTYFKFYKDTVLKVKAKFKAGSPSDIISIERLSYDDAALDDTRIGVLIFKA